MPNITPEMIDAAYNAFALHEWENGRAKRGPERSSLEAALSAALSVEAGATPGPYQARWVPSGMPTDCCEYGVVSLSEGKEICRVWKEEDARHIETLLNAPPAPAASEPVGEAGEMPGSNGGFTMAAFKASDVPLGSKLYTHPAPPPAVEGWRMVPEEPTKEMQEAGFIALGSQRDCDCDQYECYRAMLDAAPAAPPHRRREGRE